MTRKLVPTRVVAERLGTTPYNVRTLVKRKGLPARRLGRVLRFDLTEVDAWTRRERSIDEAAS